MNRVFATKFPSLVLLLVMLLNPIIGMAGSLLLEKNTQEVQSMDMSGDMSESCNDHVTTNSASSDEDSTQKHSECCEEPCMCGQSGCHTPAATMGSTSSSYDAHPAHFNSNAVNYRSPTLSFQTPPPII